MPEARRSAGAPRLSRRAALEWLVAGGVLFAFSLHFALRRAALIGGGTENLSHFVIGDDAFYYLKIAFNWAHGRGSSFDGISRTNGYQPLWQWLLAVLARAFDGKNEFLQAVQWLVVGLHVAMAWVLFGTLGKRFSAAIGLLAGFLWLLAQPLFTATFAMESSLYALLLWALHLAWRARDGSSGGDSSRVAVALGLLAGLVALARLEALLLIGVLGLTLLIEWRRGATAFRSVVAFGAGATAVLLPYFVSNRIAFGELFPVSVIVKSSGASFRWELLVQWTEAIFGSAGFPNLLVRDWNGGVVTRFGPWAAWVHALVIAGAACGAIALALRNAARAGAARAIPADVPFLGFLLAHWLVVGSGRASNWPHIWHFVPEFLAIAVLPAACLGAAFASLASNRERRAAKALHHVAVCALALLGVYAAPTAWRHWDWGGGPPYERDGWTRAVEWANANLAPDAVLGSWDSGFFGFFLERPVLNLDGRVADLDFVRTVLDTPDNYLSYLERKGVTHLINEEPVPPPAPDRFISIPRERLEPVAEWPASESGARRIVLLRFKGSSGS